MGQQSFTPEEILAASFAYTRSTVEGAGAIKGKNCQIQSIDPITGGVRITFVWYLDDGTEQTDTADVMNGADGKGIKSVAIDSDEHLIITYTDNTTSDAGKIEVQSAVTSVNGKKGDVQLKTSDITNDSDYVSDANYVHTDNNYDDTAKGIVDGVTAKLAKKVDKVTGKDLSTNDYTDADKAIVDNVTTNLAGKVDKISGKDLSTNDYTNDDKAIVDGVTAALANKVDKISGKDLSTNDYTNTDKAIVDGVTAELADKANITDVIDSASYDSNNHTILFKHGDTTLFSLDAAAFVKDGMIDTVTVTGGNLVITFNTDAGKQDISIPISDIFDANNYYNKTAIDNLLSAKQDTLTFDNTPTANSNNPVRSGGVYTEIDSLKETLTNEVSARAELGAHNLFTFDLEEIKKYNTIGTWNGNVYTVSASGTSITFTVNNDNSITVNGMLTGANVFFNLVGNTTSYKENNFKNMIMSGCPSDGGDTSGYQMVALTATSASGTGSTSFSDTGSGVTIDNKDYLNVYIRASKDKTITNKTFYPMFCLATDAYTGYTPYAKTNKELTKDTKGLTDNEFVNGVVNLLENKATSQVVNGITWVVNSDGTVAASGTATANTFIKAADINNHDLTLNKGTYRFVACPSGGSNSNYYAYITDGQTQANDYGEGAEYNITNDNTDVAVILYVMNGQTVNITFKPMITVADMPNSDYNHYVPYAKSNKELTDALAGFELAIYEGTAPADTTNYKTESVMTALGFKPSYFTIISAERYNNANSIWYQMSNDMAATDYVIKAASDSGIDYRVKFSDVTNYTKYRVVILYKR